MSSIQGVTSAPPVRAPQVQKPVVQPVHRDTDGDADKAGAVDRDKGTKVDVQG